MKGIAYRIIVTSMFGLAPNMGNLLVCLFLATKSSLILPYIYNGKKRDLRAGKEWGQGRPTHGFVDKKRETGTTYGRYMGWADNAHELAPVSDQNPEGKKKNPTRLDEIDR